VSKGDVNLFFYPEKIKNLLQDILDKYRNFIFIVSIGALIRIIAPFLKGKDVDPAIVAIDENGEYVISILSGHIGGANELCRKIAAGMGARAVITTASDVQKTLTVDTMGKEFGWYMEPSEYLTEISAAVVNGETVAIVQESGEKNWWKYETGLPENLILFNTLEEGFQSNAPYHIIITHRDFQKMPDFESSGNKKIVIFRPKVIGIGLGCNRNTTQEELDHVTLETLQALKFNVNSVMAVASIDLKENESGLLLFCSKRRWRLYFYTVSELNSVAIQSPSEVVFKYTGAYGVSEPAAKILTKNSTLALVKKKSGNVTISIGLTS
ncbi:MAG: cobalamin biosynthesis protein, partial [Spirochaetia bacterium]|nr:cobalamin biosynthesis protein [Spirochaetia bacterium]